MIHKHFLAAFSLQNLSVSSITVMPFRYFPVHRRDGLLLVDDGLVGGERLSAHQQAAGVLAFSSRATAASALSSGSKTVPNPRLSYVAEAFEPCEYVLGGKVRADTGGVDLDVGVRRHLVGVIDAGEALDETRPDLCVEALAVAGLASLEGSRNVHLDKSSGRLDSLSQIAAGGRVGRDKSADRDSAVTCGLGGDEADAPQVDLSVLAGEPEFAGKVLAHDIPVEQRHRSAVALSQHRRERIGECRLAGAGQTGEQHRKALSVARCVAHPVSMLRHWPKPCVRVLSPRRTHFG